MLQPWFQEKYFPEQNINYGAARLHYEFNVEVLPKDVKIMFELQKNERILVDGNSGEVENNTNNMNNNSEFTAISTDYNLINSN